MCRVLGVSPGGYYARLKRPPSALARADAELSAKIAAIHGRSRATYGAPRIHAELAEQGIRVGCKRVARLMRAAGRKGASRRNWIITTVRDRGARPAPDLVERDFSAAAPNRLWVADITYIPTWAGFLYLAVVLDAFSRKIVGWAMETYLRTELVLKALEMALGQRRAPGVIHHSDQGSQYTSLAFGKRCDEVGVKPSMGSVGDCFDNAMCESFFATLECELLNRRSFKTQVEARMAVFDFIEGWYNPHRRHSALDYHSPVEYERLHCEYRVRGSAAAGGAWPADQMLAGAPHRASASNAEPITLSGPASNRVEAGTEKLLSGQAQEHALNEVKPRR
jgi:putative transposase